MLSCSRGLERCLPRMLALLRVPAAGLTPTAVSRGLLAGPVAWLSVVTAQHGPLEHQWHGGLAAWWWYLCFCCCCCCWVPVPLWTGAFSPFGFFSCL